MSGLGRRTHYRKHLTDTVLHDLPEPKDDERLAKVVATRGGNQFDIIEAAPKDSSGKKIVPQLAILPTKFRKLVWVKRGDFVIVRTVAEGDDNESDEAGGIRFLIVHILYKEQIKHLKSIDLWPVHDVEFMTVLDGDDQGGDIADGNEDDEIPEDGIVYDAGYDDDGDLFVNTNRLAALKVQDSSDTESDDD